MHCMNIEGYKVMICDCGKTMAIDGETLSKACGAKNECSVATSLCRSQTDDLAEALLQAFMCHKSHERHRGAFTQPLFIDGSPTYSSTQTSWGNLCFPCSVV